MTSARMTFGTYKHVESCDVPLDYLVWAGTKMRAPPECVILELELRASRHGSREAVEAQAVLSALASRPVKTRRPRKRKRPRRRPTTSGRRRASPSKKGSRKPRTPAANRS